MGESMNYLNLGSGTIMLGNQQGHPILEQSGLPEHIFTDPDINWLNVDKLPLQPEAGKQFLQCDLFRYPWSDLETDAYDGALLSNICEHIPHNVHYKDAQHWHDMSDGWFCFFSELWRVLKDDSPVYIVSPYGVSDRALSDPSHTRFLIIDTFAHTLDKTPWINATEKSHEYNAGGVEFKIVEYQLHVDTQNSNLGLGIYHPFIAISVQMKVIK